MKFSDIPGHDHVKHRLKQMVADNRVPHALMLHGVPGIGKLALARALAQRIHCANPGPDGDSCGVCPSCLQHKSLNHIDTVYSYPVPKRDGGKDTVSSDYADDWRKYLTANMFMDFAAWHASLGKKMSQPQIPRAESRELLRRVSTTAHVSDRKIVIMWLPERMNEQAANGLLKLIEEPFADTSFIFVSDNPAAIIQTIRSRCQMLEVPRLSDDVIAGYMAATKGLDPADAMALANIAEGSMAEALRQLANDGDNAVYLDLFIRLMRLAYMRDVSGLRVWANELTALGREQETKFHAYCQRMIRENFILNFGNRNLSYLNRAEEAFSSRFSRFITERNAERLAAAFNDAMIDIEGNGNGKIVKFDLAIRVILLLK